MPEEQQTEEQTEDPNAIPLELGSEPFEEFGRSGLEQWYGTIHEERLRQLVSNTRRFETFTEMSDNDPIVGAVLLAFDLLIRQVDWRVDPHEDGSEEDAAFITECLDDLDMDFKDVVSDIFTFMTHGWSYHETNFKKRKGTQPLLAENATSKYTDGRVGWKSFASRSQKTLHKWEFDEDTGTLLGMWQQAPPRYDLRFIPIVKALHFRTTTKGQNPEGKSVLRNAYRPWYFKKTFEELQAIGVDRDLAGLPVLYAPSEYLKASGTAEQMAMKTELKKMLRQVRRGSREGMLLPSDVISAGSSEKKFQFELASSGGRRQFDIKATLEYYDQRIAMTSLADAILLGHESVGSFALADSKTNLLAMAVGAFLDIVAAQFNRVAIPQLLELNGLSTENIPELVHSDMEDISLTDMSTLITALSGAGALLFPDEDLENHIRTQAGMPPRTDDSLYEEANERREESMQMMRERAQSSNGDDDNSDDDDDEDS